jgi:hypothetical protein
MVIRCSLPVEDGQPGGHNDEIYQTTLREFGQRQTDYIHYGGAARNMRINETAL